MASGDYVSVVIDDLIELRRRDKEYLSTLVECLRLLNERISALEERLETLSDHVWGREDD